MMTVTSVCIMHHIEWRRPIENDCSTGDRSSVATSPYRKPLSVSQRARDLEPHPGRIEPDRDQGEESEVRADIEQRPRWTISVIAAARTGRQHRTSLGGGCDGRGRITLPLSSTIQAARSGFCSFVNVLLQ